MKSIHILSIYTIWKDSILRRLLPAFAILFMFQSPAMADVMDDSANYSEDDSAEYTVENRVENVGENISELPSLAPTLNSAVAELPDSLQIGSVNLRCNFKKGKEIPLSIYDLPYSFTGTCYDWKRLWINAGVLTGAFVGTLIVLETAPEGSTNWSKAEIRSTPWYERWVEHVIDQGPQFDKDKWYFNYLLHPYAGAAYFMAARSCGFNFWQSLFFSSIISNVAWEFGVEATMERPSLQDLLVTPLIGSLIGEGFYKLKRIIADNNYTLFGSKILGNVVAFIIDPVNEVIGFFAGNPARRVAKLRQYEISSSPIINPGAVGSPQYGLSLTCVF